MIEVQHQIKQELLRWYKTFGVDHLFREDFGRAAALKQEAHPVTLLKKQSSPSVQADICRDELNFSSIDELRAAVFKMDFPLKRTARNTVFSDGNPNSDVMIIGEAPGQEEDEQGKPFGGQRGKLLNNMLASVGLARSDVYISNILFWRPPGNRTPSAEEISVCMPYVQAHVRLAKPKVLLLLGGVAIKSVLNTTESISRLRGSRNVYEGVDTIATFHPAYLLRSPGQKAAAFRDFILLKKLLDVKQGVIG
ncbi:MAG: uracil-DNA glycosylase [Alphaproteobacteria bacterium]|nr:uracil-DNA glycosylase [Alphaproteobacteria bacterium]